MSLVPTRRGARLLARRPLLSVLLATGALVVGATTANAATGFLEDDVVVLGSLVGDDPIGFFGWVAANVGDVDADGVDDLAVPSPNFGGAAGRVVVYSGATRQPLATHVGRAGDQLGYAVATAGDVDGDGTPDVVAGAPGDDFRPTPLTAAGRAVVWSGADGSMLMDLQGRPGEFFGGAVWGAGDLDADGHGDVLVGAKFAAGNRGEVTAHSGADGSVLWTATGRKVGDTLGTATGRVGDVDGDGVGDVVAGAGGAKKGRGTAYVLSGVDGSIIHQLNPQGDGQVFGVFFASGAGDVDADGIGDVFVGDYAAGKANQANNPVFSGAAYVFSGATGERLYRFEGDRPGEGVGPGRGVGDVDGDGHDDVIVAGYLSSAGAPAAGKAWVRSGRTGEVLQEITSTTAFENVGVDALGLGDVDGDGRTDFVVTAVGLSFAGIAPGTVYVVAGTTP